jgi:hypothetical protein
MRRSFFIDGISASSSASASSSRRFIANLIHDVPFRPGFVPLSPPFCHCQLAFRLCHRFTIMAAKIATFDKHYRQQLIANRAEDHRALLVRLDNIRRRGSVVAASSAYP